MKAKERFKVGLLCGGPSLERGISLNSARSVLDHLESPEIEIVPVYFDHEKKAYKISTAQLYSNNPSDFDFKLSQVLDTQSLVRLLRSVDIVFPVMHGSFGEDGEIQTFLEKNNIPFVGTSSTVCKKVFDKYEANELIRSKGFFTLPSIVLKIYGSDHKKVVEAFFKEHNLKRAIVKPATGGSSIGVFSVCDPEEALVAAETLFSKRMDTRVVIEPFAQGVEFTTIILQNRFGLPVAILPTEIETDYTKNQFFDFRKKYLPTRQVTYHCPPRFSNEMIERIQVEAEQLFSALGMRDFARFDGWVFPDGKVWFSDFNPISGMEQNSFLFQQASRVGLSHKNVLRFIVARATERYGKFLPINTSVSKNNKKAVNVLFGGKTSERQVSLMSGTNVWLKLQKSEKYEPTPFLLDTDDNVWQLPYAYTLNHTVEEIRENCSKAKENEARLGYLEYKVRLRLALQKGESNESLELPRKMSLQQFLSVSKFVFIALHGGDGENGTLQKLLSKHEVLYNGSGEKVSELCMDKWQTSHFIHQAKILGVKNIPAKVIPLKAVVHCDNEKIKKLWKDLTKELRSKTLIVKPRADGCSSGVVHLYSSNDLKNYIHFAEKNAQQIPKSTFTNQNDFVEMPLEKIEDLLFEKFIITDSIRVKGTTLKYIRKSGWVEMTVGVVETEKGLHVFNPSITIAEGEVLSVEEKFQGGTGVNITPPPSSIIKQKTLALIKKRIGEIAQALGIQGYSRIDIFANITSGEVYLIEPNTLPGLTPSTVLYHQALAESTPIFPKDLLEKLIKNKGY